MLTLFPFAMRHRAISLSLLFLALTWAGASQSRAQAIAFTDVTAAAGLTHYHDSPVVEILNIIPEEAPPSASSMDLSMMTAGAAAGDFNNDGWMDLFALGGGLQPDALYINNQDGTFSEQAESWQVAALHVGSGATAGDYNGDGWLDLFITSFGDPVNPSAGQHRLYRNNGDGTFTDVAAEAGVNRVSPDYLDGFGATFGDYDLDGDLDLYVAGWLGDRRWYIPAQGNRLFRNNGDGTFTDVSEDAGVLVSESHGFTPCFADMDGDRFPELLLTADYASSRYFVNNGDGTFTDTTDASGTNYASNGMGAAIADFNNDGYLDWYETSIYDEVVTETRDGSKRDGNELYYNQGNHVFTISAKESGVDDGAWGWGTVAVDMNHDGWVDIVETNGWPEDRLDGRFYGVLSRLWINNADHSFTETALDAGFDHDLDGRGLLYLDYDNDGDQDLVVTAHRDSLRLYRNDLAGPSANWLRLFLDTRADPTLAPHGFGARVIATVDGQQYHRYLDGCAGYLTQSELSLHFGLGDAETVDELRVEWTNGAVTTLTDVAVNETITVKAGAQPTAVEDAAPPAGFELRPTYPNPFTAETTIPYALAEPGAVTLSVYNVLGQKVTTLIDRFQSARAHSARWNGTDDHGSPVPSGLYVVRLEANGAAEVRRMVRLR